MSEQGLSTSEVTTRLMLGIDGPTNDFGKDCRAASKTRYSSAQTRTSRQMLPTAKVANSQISPACP
ncbi:MAG: hypothetical protein ACKVIQ_13940, partial [Acidimicrobiales bacterium]